MRQRGFTLLELLVAISVLALVSLIAWRGLDSLVSTRERLEPEAETLRSELAAFGQLDRDLAATVPVSLLAGGEPGLRLIPTASGDVLEVLRLAPPAPDGSSRVQRVRWQVEDNTLVRRAAPPAANLAPAPAESWQVTPLLADVQRLALRGWRPGQGWSRELPAAPVGGALPPGTPPGAGANTPAGVEIELLRTNNSPLRRVVMVGAP